MSEGGESESAQNSPPEQPQPPHQQEPSEPPAGSAAAPAAGNQAGPAAENKNTANQNNAGSTANAPEGVPELVDDILAAKAPSGWWIAAAFGILAVGIVGSYFVWRAIKPTDFMPSSNYAVYAGLFVMATAIERVLEPFSGWFIPSTENKKMTATVAKVKANVVSAKAATSPEKPEAQADAVAARKQAAGAQHAFHLAQSTRAVLMWATASVLAMLACAVLGIFLLRSVETPSATGATTASTSAAATKSVPSGPTPAKDPNRFLDLLITGLVVGAGTKPLHDLISQIQTSSGSSKASSSAPTTAS